MLEYFTNWMPIILYAFIFQYSVPLTQRIHKFGLLFLHLLHIDQWFPQVAGYDGWTCVFSMAHFCEAALLVKLSII